MILKYTINVNMTVGSSSSSSKFYFQQNTTIKQ